MVFNSKSLVFLQLAALSLFITPCIESHPNVQEAEVGPQIEENDENHQSNAQSSQCIVFKFEGLSQPQYDALVSFMEVSGQTNFKVDNNSDSDGELNGGTNETEEADDRIKLIKGLRVEEKMKEEKQIQEMEKTEWWMEEVVIPNNLTDLLTKRNRTKIVASSHTGYFGGSSWTSSLIDPHPWAAYDLSQRRKIFYIQIELYTHLHRFKNVKIYYGDEKKNTFMDITKEKLFAEFKGPVYNLNIFKPSNALYVEGRYVYIAKFPNPSNLIISSVQIYGN